MAEATVTEADMDRAAEYLAALLPEMPLLAERVKANGAGLARFFAAHRIATQPDDLTAAAQLERSGLISREKYNHIVENIRARDRKREAMA